MTLLAWQLVGSFLSQIFKLLGTQRDQLFPNKKIADLS